MSRKWNFTDYQQEKVYKAELEWEGFPRQQLSNAQSRRLIHQICTFAEIKPPKIFLKAVEKFDGVRFTSRVASGGMEYIRLPEWAMTSATICHEMGHVIAQQRDIFDGHGPNFCGIFVELVHKFMGSSDGTDLQWSFLLNSVEVEYNNI